MNWEHLKAFVWLRWRLMRNQWRRAGAVNAALMIILVVGALVAAVPLFIGSLTLGLYAIPKAAPAHLLYAWDALIVSYLFFWCIGLMVDLQRSDSLSLAKFLHLPVSANGAFLINYLSSFVRLSLIVFVPMMLGYAVALVVARGISQLLVLPLLAAFLLMVTALTYQFQGWLAALMSNPRRRRTVIVTVTALFILVCQVPNLINMSAPWNSRQVSERVKAQNDEMQRLVRTFNEQAAKDGKFDGREFARRKQALEETHKRARDEAFQHAREHWERTARLANMVVPIGWLPLGVMSAAEGRYLPPVLGLLGLTAIGLVSLRRAYATTVGQFQGRSSSRPPRPAGAVAPVMSGPRKRLLIEARIPGLSEPVSAIALGGVASLLRSPEAKMALLTPVLMCGIFGWMMFGSRNEMPRFARPLLATGGIAFVLLGVVQLAANQFGIDRDGFRVFVLSSIRRRDILLGKNLAHAPIAIGMGLIVLAAVQVFCPLRLDHALAMVPQLVSMFALFCILTNMLSIYCPIHMPAGSLKPTNVKVSTVLLQTAVVTILFPMTQSLALLPLGTELLLEYIGWTHGLPLCLALSLLECVVVLLVFWGSLVLQGHLLQGREQQILEIVTNRAA